MALYAAGVADSVIARQWKMTFRCEKMRMFENLPVELWDQVVSRSEYATFFHTSAWAQIIVETYPHFHIATKGFMLDDGRVAIVPMVGTIERNRYFKWYESMFPGGYGGAVAERSLTQRETNTIFRQLASAATAYIHVMGNPYTDHNLPLSYSRSTQYTHVLSLAEGFDAILSNYSSEKRRSIKKAAKMEVEVSVAETEQEFRSYYEVYEDTLRRWGDTTLMRYPYSLFEQIYRHRSDAIRLWVAKVKGEIVSGDVFFYHNQHVVYWHGATRESYFSHHPAPLLMTDIIKDACQRGFRYCDLGPSGGLKGVENYKEGFGAQKKLFCSYVWKGNRLYHAYQKLRGLGQSALNRAPFSRDLDQATFEAAIPQTSDSTELAR